MDFRELLDCFSNLSLIGLIGRVPLPDIKSSRKSVLANGLSVFSNALYLLARPCGVTDSLLKKADFFRFIGVLVFWLLNYGVFIELVLLSKAYSASFSSGVSGQNDESTSSKDWIVMSSSLYYCVFISSPSVSLIAFKYLPLSSTGCIPLLNSTLHSSLICCFNIYN